LSKVFNKLLTNELIMGQLLAGFLGNGDCEFACINPNNGQSLLINFVNAQPTESEKETYDEAEKFIIDSDKIIEELKSFKVAEAETKLAMSKPSPETERKAWDAVVPNMFKLKEFCDFSKRMSPIVTKIFKQLCAPGASGLVERLDSHQALVKQLAKVLDAVFKLDEFKMVNSGMSNDISYFRRKSQSLGRKMGQESQRISASFTNIDVLDVDTTNTISLFFADPTPFLKALVKSMTDFVMENTGASNLTIDILGTMFKVCLKLSQVQPEEIPETSEFKIDDETKLFIIRVMVGLVVLYDHVDEKNGAFNKGSHISVKDCLAVVKKQEESISKPLLDVLRFRGKTAQNLS